MPPPRIRFTPEMDAAIRELRAKGEWWRRIADRVGVDRKTLMRRVDELGISRQAEQFPHRRSYPPPQA